MGRLLVRRSSAEAGGVLNAPRREAPRLGTKYERNEKRLNILQGIELEIASSLQLS